MCVSGVCAVSTECVCDIGVCVCVCIDIHYCMLLFCIDVNCETCGGIGLMYICQ